MLLRLFPHPLLSVWIVAVWVLLANEVTFGQLVLGLILGVLIPLATSAYWPGRPRVGAPLMMIEFMLVVLWDIVVSNIQVASLILFRRGDSLQSRFITLPLDLRSPEAITVLAGTITMTPGTVSADVSADGRALLVHCLETDGAEATVAQIKQRYERRLKRIFE
ncbi:MAG: Na+/H+ antiporter subunit E [Bosea sp. (in: a-proteobacteria)]|uniref:Na+/H+ antiporter subunit E n=1 Tax=Bosea sp. (in: a-proteobacteria) TaxID=1871050 RepID=UPI0027372C02|nr:Na+/H+ antiporter subunit E [Bosea sp. (in: a-proteobacteria)]MDP3257015.1 Na+/H+ antiporter subunit E [Bosea sp. (in: a-proteobacteria)]MDP3319194.1 Na+/H+ antiporter subunit E [Bosea sp. (in: a-proteobacteria)]